MISISDVVLDCAQRLDEARRRNRFDPGRNQRAVTRMGEMVLLEPDSPACKQLADLGHEVPRCLDEGHAFDLATPCRVAEVGIQRGRRVRLDQHRGVRALQAGQIAHVRLAAEHVRRTGDEERLLEERCQSFDPGHGRLCMRNSSASRYPSGPLPMILASTTPSSTETRRQSSRSSMFERCTSTTGTVKSSTASRIAHE